MIPKKIRGGIQYKCFRCIKTKKEKLKKFDLSEK